MARSIHSCPKNGRNSPSVCVLLFSCLLLVDQVQVDAGDVNFENRAPVQGNNFDTFTNAAWMQGNRATPQCDANARFPRASNDTIPCCLLPPALLQCSQCGRETPDDVEDLLCEQYSNKCEEGVRTVVCWALNPSDCSGNKEFYVHGVACDNTLEGTKHFPVAFILSLLLGWAGADRLYLGHIGIGIAKLFSLGGFGIFWLLDLIFLINGDLAPAGSDAWAAFNFMGSVQVPDDLAYGLGETWAAFGSRK